MSSTTPAGLVDALAALCRKETAVLDCMGSDGAQQTHAPSIYAHCLPYKGYRDGEVDTAGFPFVVVSFLAGSAEGREGTCSIGLRIGTYAPEDDDREGWRAAMNLSWRLVAALLRKPRLGAYTLKAPVDWELPPDQEPPYWFASVVLDYTIPLPLDEQVSPDPWITWDTGSGGNTFKL